MATTRRTNSPRQKPQADPAEAPLTPGETPDVAVATEPETADEEAVENATITDAEAQATAEESDDRREPEPVVGPGTRKATVIVAGFSYPEGDITVTAVKGDTVTVAPEVYERGIALGALA